MRTVFLVAFFYTSLFGVTITSHNVYTQDDSIDLFLSFDKPYHGRISQKKDKNSTILMLETLNLDQSILKEINTTIIQKIHIVPYKEHTFVKVFGADPFVLQASKTVDNSGLRIRAKSTAIKPVKQTALITKKEQDVSSSFLKVIAVLVFLFLLLFLIKKWLTYPRSTSNSWLFHKDPNKIQDIKIIHQKMIDTKNRVVLLEFNAIRYLVILGNNNIILDKYESGDKDTAQGFDTLLTQNDKKLNEVLTHKGKKITK